ncbi:MAG: hypothetical protein HYX53_15150 [Chloroflexi bacterium]|nr:hypothetical protein [Chloroflexota bacterium]
MALLTRFRKRDPREDASAYIDGQLGAAECARFEAGMAKDAALARYVQELRGTRQAIAALPDAPAPRSFRLTQAMLQGQRVPSAAAAPRPLFALRVAQVAAAVGIVGLAIAVVADMTGGSSTTTSNTLTAAQDSASSPVRESAKATGPGTGANAPAAAGATTASGAATSPAVAAPGYSATNGAQAAGAATASPTPTPTAATSPTPRAPATGPGPAATPVPPNTGGPTAAPTGNTSSAAPQPPATGAESPQTTADAAGSIGEPAAPARAPGSAVQDDSGPGAARVAEIVFAGVAAAAVAAWLVLRKPWGA